MTLGPHAVYIWSCYAIVAAAMGLLIGWLILDGRQQRRLLAEFEARGVRRRSAGVEPPAAGHEA